MLCCNSVFGRLDITKLLAGKTATIVSAVLFFVFVVGEPALAQEAMLQEMATSAGFGGAPLPIIVARLIRTFISLLGIVAVVIVIYAGWLYMTAGGDADQVNRAKRMLTQGAIGLFLIFASFSITQFVLNALLADTDTGPQVTSTSPTDLYSEPLSAALGSGVIDDHYPPRNAIDIPRNTNIFITFKQPLDPDSIIADYTDDPENNTGINDENVLIYPSEQGEEAALAQDDVVVTANDDQTIFTFNPVDLLGSANEDMNYTVALTPQIQLADGSNAFEGQSSDGYEWTFEVSTEVDWTPPTVTSVQPAANDTHPRNTAIEVTFNEAMNPVAATGVLDESNSTADNFNNVEVFTGDTGSLDRQNGEYQIGNNYRTITYLSDDLCAEDPCGNPVYCLPGNEDLHVWAHSAPLSDDPPQAALTQGLYGGLVDAAGNALDGNENFDPDSPEATMEGRGDDGDPGDDYRWEFGTSADLDTRVPEITDLSPDIDGENVGQDQPVEISFNMPMMGSALHSDSAQLWPAPWYQFWWSVSKMDVDENGDPVTDSADIDHSVVMLDHPTFIPPEEQAWDYYPLVNEEAKGINQFCAYPSAGPGAAQDGSCDTSESEPYCCNGEASSQACETEPRTLDNGTQVDPIQLPDTSE